MKKSISGNVVKFVFDEGVEALEFDCEKLSAENQAHAVPFGMCHRLGDMAAIPKSKANGFKVTEAMRRAEIAAGIAHYESGTADWNLKAGVRAAPQNPVIVKIAAKLGITYEQAQAKIAEQFLEELA